MGLPSLPTPLPAASWGLEDEQNPKPEQQGSHCRRQQVWAARCPARGMWENQVRKGQVGIGPVASCKCSSLSPSGGIFEGNRKPPTTAHPATYAASPPTFRPQILLTGRGGVWHAKPRGLSLTITSVSFLQARLRANLPIKNGQRI